MKMHLQPILRAAGVAACAICAVWADTGGISGPVTGFLFDAPTRTLRPVLGIPGASTIGQPMDLGFDVGTAAVAPGQDFLLAGGTDGGVRLVTLAGTPVANGFDALHGAPARIVFSPRGTAAALVNADTADIYTGLPGEPSLVRTVPLASTPSALAVSDDGNSVVAVFGGALSVAGGSAEWQAVSGVADAALAAFAPGSHDAAVVSSGGVVTLYHAIGEGGDTATLTAPDSPIDSAVGVAFNRAGKVLVAGGSARMVTILDPGGAASVSVACGCSPSELTPMGTLFRLNELGDGPLWLLDTGSDQPKLFFVPALPAQAAPSSETGQ